MNKQNVVYLTMEHRSAYEGGNPVTWHNTSESSGRYSNWNKSVIKKTNALRVHLSEAPGTVKFTELESKIVVRA
jgi:hypothetical protein